MLTVIAPQHRGWNSGRRLTLADAGARCIRRCGCSPVWLVLRVGDWWRCRSTSYGCSVAFNSDAYAAPVGAKLFLGFRCWSGASVECAEDGAPH
jgi:hypothetical protein